MRAAPGRGRGHASSKSAPTQPTPSFGWLSLYTDPWGQNIYFATQTNDGTSAVYLSAPVTWTTNYWRWIALTYSSTNSSLYVDGTLLTNGPGVTVWPPQSVTTNGFWIGSRSDGSNVSRGMFDDLETFNYVMSPQTISNWFGSVGVSFWANPLNPANLATAPYDMPVPAPGFRAIMGAGYLHLISSATNCATNSNIWMTNVIAKLTNNGTMNLTFKIAGGSPGVVYDVYGTDGLVGNSITNAQWYWCGQGLACCTYEITNLPGTTALFVLGQPTDDDQDGLPNAFEILVSKSDPHNASTLGNGLPDWWPVVYAGTAAADPYGDADGDGWSNLEEYQNGTDPNHFDTPPPPQNVVAAVGGSGTNITITWASGGGPVTNYVIERGWNGGDEAAASQIGNVSPTTFSFPDTFSDPLNHTPYDQPEYYVRAYFSNGSSAVSAGATPSQPALSTRMTIARGALGQPYIVLASPPPDFSNVILFWQGFSFADSANISSTSFVNGVAPLPSGAQGILPADSTDFAFQLFATNSGFAESFPVDAAPLADTNRQEYSATSSVYRFVDARRHLKENLMFLLRTAGRQHRLRLCLSARDFRLRITVFLRYDLAHPESGFVRPMGNTN